MYRLDLNGRWALCWCEPGEGEERQWRLEGVPPDRRIEASVPGDVHLDLIGAGLLEEPLVGLNAPNCSWMEGKDWWYSRRFHCSEEALGVVTEIVFEGLDTTAHVWLNGKKVGQSGNAHVPHVFDVTGAVRGGTNLLVVRVDDGLRAASGKELAPYQMQKGHELQERMWIRKPQFTFGWDWSPRLLTCGIWRSVQLRSYRGMALRDLCLRAQLKPEGGALVHVVAEVENFTGAAADFRLTVALSRGRTHRVELEESARPGRSTVRAALDVPEPALWWPAPLGEPALYEVEAELLIGGERVDGRQMRYGIREVELIQEPLGEEGTRFAIAVNGEKVFCKGANWVPADSILARVSPAKYRALVQAAWEANFNMLRVWGGGTFEDETFYDLCDEYGILLWHDFMFACSYYPDDDSDFVEEARREAEKAVRRLRNHPCVALWCGNNENQWLHHDLQQEGGAPERFPGGRIYDEVLPEVCGRLDPGTPYWPSSPYGGDEPNSEWEGDRHAWDVSIRAPTVAEKVDYGAYERDRGKFITEFGVLAPAPLESVRRYLPHGELNRKSDSWAFHNNEFEQGTLREALKRYWRPAEGLSLAEYVRMGQTIQAEALKLALEHWRRRKFRTAGALFWMYADCWGEVGWTVIDYYLERKPSYWAVRRAFAPVLPSFAGREDGGMALWIVNDIPRAVEVELQYGWLHLPTGETERRRMRRRAPRNGAEEVARLSPPGGEPEEWMAFVRLEGRECGDIFNRRFPAGFDFNRIPLPEAHVECALSDGGDELVVTADAFAWQVHLKVPRGVEVGDNDFDLMPGETRRVEVRGPRGMKDQVEAGALNGP